VKTDIIDPSLENRRFRLSRLLDDLFQMVGQKDGDGLGDLIRDVRDHLSEPFLFVVVGEIKAGKSSFINALLGADICAVDPAPCTDTVQEIVWSSEPSEQQLVPHLKRIGRPVNILKTVAVVDTPGTNTLIQHHQEITQRFIPNSDLVLFVFPAKNPYTRSAWEMLDFVRSEWRKRVVFILQQADLATESELAINRAKVLEIAKGYDILTPLVFATSARWEADRDDRSGFDEVRDFIRRTVTGGREVLLKLQSSAVTAAQLIERVSAVLDADRQDLEAEQQTAATIRRRVDGYREQTLERLADLADRLTDAYDHAANDLKRQLDSELQALPLFRRSIGSVFRKDASVNQWIGQLQQSFSDQLQRGIEKVLTQDMAPMLDGIRDLVQQLLTELEQHPAGRMRPSGIDPGVKRDEVVHEIRRRLEAALPGGDVSDMAPGAGKLSSTLVGGGALTLVGGILLLTTHVAFLDITGGLMTGVGLLMAGGVLAVRRRKLMAVLGERLADGRRQLSEAAADLTPRLSTLFEDIKNSFRPYYHYVAEKEAHLAARSGQRDRIRDDLQALAAELAEGGGATRA
jgi:GTPase SAR1 family protein